MFQAQQQGHILCSSISQGEKSGHRKAGVDFPGLYESLQGFPGDLVVKNPPANAGGTGDLGLIPGSGRSPGGGNGNPFQYSCLENLMDRGVWRAIFHGVTKSQTRLSTHECMWVTVRTLRSHYMSLSRERDDLIYALAGWPVPYCNL